jgi:hypothetical protein
MPGTRHEVPGKSEAPGRVRLRPNRGFPRRPACGITPKDQPFDSITMCTAIDLLREKMRDAPGRAACSNPSENL